MVKKKKKSALPLIIILAITFIILIGVIFIYISKSKKGNEKHDSSSLSSISDSTISDVDSSQSVPDSSTADSSSTVDSSSTADSSSKVESSVTDNEDEALAAFSSLSYFNSSYAERYKAYKKLNSNLPYEQAILHVNIGLDRPFYTNTFQALNYTSISALVNKYSYLPSTYAPSDLKVISSQFSDGTQQLRAEAATAFEKMCTDAKAQGYSIKAISTYRSYSYQKGLYDRYVQQDGVAAANTYSAKAGHSEHQTGLVADVRGSKYYYERFDEEKENKFVLENAYKYGFIVRYPVGKEHITGYMAEPWHLRYVGVDIATVLHNEKITFDEYCAKYRT